MFSLSFLSFLSFLLLVARCNRDRIGLACSLQRKKKRPARSLVVRIPIYLLLSVRPFYSAYLSVVLSPQPPPARAQSNIAATLYEPTCVEFWLRWAFLGTRRPIGGISSSCRSSCVTEDRMRAVFTRRRMARRSLRSKGSVSWIRVRVASTCSEWSMGG